MRKLFYLWAALSAVAARAENFTVRDGDRVVLAGDTLIEREQEAGWLETITRASFPDCHLTVRNLGWSGDTPAGQSRASFDFNVPGKGFQLLTDAVSRARPTVVMIGYGMASSFAGAEGLPQFKKQTERLLDAIQHDSSGPVRFVIFSPLRHQKLPPPMPDPARHNAMLADYTSALRQIALARGIPFVDLFDAPDASRLRNMTDDGIHLTVPGYHWMALETARQLGWHPSIKSSDGPMVEKMRWEITHKDQLFFDRWRPENQTYLFGFRQNEQGKNAKEIPEFDPLISDSDERIFQWQQAIAGRTKQTPAPMVLSERAKGKEAPPLPDFDVAPGFEVSLWASSPLLAKPTQINFDPRGRLWVAESSIYPQIAPGQKANDKIVILEDTRHTGHADKSTVFVDGLFVPTAVEPGDGGCYVGQSTELLYFAGDDKAKSRRVVLSGFGTEDTHHLVHTLQWGPDGMLYFDQSIYIHSHLETPNGVVRLNSGGVYHLRPDSMRLGVFLRGFCNPWGHQFDAFGQSFVTDGAGFQGISWGIPGATYFTYADMRRELPSISPGSYPKYCSLAIVASRQFPDDWQGNMLTADFRAHRIVRFAVNPDGAGYVSAQLPDVLRTTNDTFRPIDLKFGPDGALYVADWCNPIINHGEVDFRDPRRDHDHGRIWRITAKGRPLEAFRDFSHATDAALLDNLLSSNSYDVQQSRRVLTERGKSILAPLKKWTSRQTSETALLQALWMHESIESRDDYLVDKLLAAQDGRVRAAATRVLAAWPRVRSNGGSAEPDACYQRLLSDPFPRVRVEALRAIAGIPSLRSASEALDTLTDKMDSFENYALWLTINDLAQPWLKGVRSGAWNYAGKEKQLTFALKSIEPELATPVLSDLLKKQVLSGGGQGPWIELIGSVGQEEDAQKLYNAILDGAFTAAAAERAWAALAADAARNIRPGGRTRELARCLAAGGGEARMQMVRLAGDWEVAACASNICSLAVSQEASDSLREAAFNSLRKIGGSQAIAILQPWTARGEPMERREPAVLALAAIDLSHAGARAVSLLEDLASQEMAMPAWRSLLSRAGAGRILSAALPTNGFPAGAAQAGLRAEREAGGKDPELVMALTRAAGLHGSEAQLSKEEVMKLADSVRRDGSASRGEKIFRSQQQSCATCHAIGGVGGRVGPDLTSIGASAQMDYLIESVYYPNKEIKDGFQSCLVETRDGGELAGILMRENDRELVLRTAADQEATVAKSLITSRKVGGSLMPSGLADNLTMRQQLDLFRFLSELGKPGPFDASSGHVARFWKVAPSDAAAAAPGPNLAGDPWHPVSSLVDGSLLRGDIKSHVPEDAKFVMAAARFRTAAAGPVHFDIPSDGTTWIDQQEVAARTSNVTTELPAGTHEVVIRFKSGDLPPSFRLESSDVTFLTN